MNDIQTHIELLDSILGMDARVWGNARKLPSAIRITESLEPVGGFGIPVYPASYAGADTPLYDLNGIVEGPEIEVRSEKGGIKKVRTIESAKHCVIDSYQSQANRMEPAFLDKKLEKLVPKVTVSIPRKKGDAVETQQEMSALHVAHRVADFRIRLSDRAVDVKDCIKAFDQGDALPMLKLFPTSVLFGFWDSRDLGTKHARILMSRIDAFNVRPCTKHSLYSGQYSKEEFANVIGLEEIPAADKLSGPGYTNALSSGQGGVFTEEITRTSVVSLTDIARIHCLGDNHEVDKEKTNAARRYLFCLALVAEAYQRETNNYSLRSGCELQHRESEKIEIRGGTPSEEFLEFCNDQTALVAVAKSALDQIGISPTPITVELSSASLSADFQKNQPKDKSAGKGATKKSKPTAKGIKES